MGTALFAAMVEEDPESDEAVKARLKRLRDALEFETDIAFAAHLGVSYKRLNNVMRGMPLGKDLGLTIVRKIGGVDLDWLYRGRPEGLSLDMARRLGELSDARRATRTPR